MEQQKQPFSIYNARIVTPDTVIENGSVVVDNGLIARITTDRVVTGERSFDAEGNYLLPGFIDMHSDAIEKEIEARPGTYLATNIAIVELDKKLAASGVTTIYHSVSFADEVMIIIRSLDVVEGIIREIKRLQDRLLINTLVHARYEITYNNGLNIIGQLIREKMIDLVSIMDHTPGQGQFKTEEQIKGYYGDRYGVDQESLKNLVETRMSVRETHGLDNARKMIQIAREHAVPIASHDDDTSEKILQAVESGVAISEFPVTMDAVRTAHENGLHIALGSPNILRGYSHNKNLSARDLIREGYGSIVCSDYIPSTLVYAFFVLIDNQLKSLPDASRMFSANPAAALGLSGSTGSIMNGLNADMIIVEHDKELPRIKNTFVKGKAVYSSCTK